ncbi:DUF58 domain-containing protein [Pseudactinotalea sp. Z1739]|uniref:DUF58 domain-containing protein n=1 Tax=Pseudactinotalea sp. Z1739 TaxID=3413028 RepID=UPI003C7AF984
MRLTLRGIGMLAAGALLAVAAAATDALALARISALLLGLIAVALVWVLGSRRRAARMRLRRRVDPPRPVVAQVATVHLELLAGQLGAWSRLRERTPALLNRSHVRAAGQQRRAWTYQIRPRERGYHRLGPSTVVHGDPLGLLRWPVRGDCGEPLLIWPRTAVLDESLRLRDLSGSEHSAFGLPERSVEDLTLREYVRGDDVHRVHWRTSARRGELMVRADEPSHPPAVDLLLDLGRKSGAEWALSAFASLAVGLVSSGVPVRLHVCARAGLDADPDVHSVTCTTAADALDVIAPATITPAALRGEQRRGLHGAGPSLIAVLHSPDVGLLHTLSPLAGHRRAYALIVTDRYDERVPAAGLAKHGWALHTARARADTSGIAESWNTLLTPLVVR